MRQLSAFLRIPSVSADSERRADMRVAAAWLRRRLRFAGGEVVESDGHPIVLAQWLGAPGAPTILVYGHYDVQPPGDLAAWDTPPFQPHVRDGRIYARGATDDKGPLLVPIAVAETMLAETGALPLNVRFLFEGEEEIGSPSLPAFLERHRDRVAADLVVSADGAMWRPDIPSVTVAARGLVALDVAIRGAVTDLHSGRYGGTAPNPLHALATVLASLHEPNGAVAVEGFYDGVRRLSAADRAALERIPFDPDAYRAEVGVPPLGGEQGYSAIERLWARPTLEVNGVWGGAAFTVIPREARAHLTCRLVPSQRPARVAEAIADHIHRHCPPGVVPTVTVQPGGVAAYSIPQSDPAVKAAMKALRHTYPGTEPLVVRMGGTLPAAAVFQETLGLRTLFFSFSSGDEGLHAPNEFFRVRRLREGIEAWSALWRLLGSGAAAELG